MTRNHSISYPFAHRRGRHSRRAMTLLACTAALLLGACAQPWESFQAGEPVSAVVARLGPPREVYTLADGTRRLMWPTQPMGEVTTAVHASADGKVLSVRQVLQPSEFYRAQIDKWTERDVLEHFGQPAEKAYFPLQKREVWSYRFLQDGQWYQLYHFLFDDAGVLRGTQQSPDPLHERAGGDNVVM